MLCIAPVCIVHCAYFVLAHCVSVVFVARLCWCSLRVVSACVCVRCALVLVLEVLSIFSAGSTVCELLVAFAFVSSVSASCLFCIELVRKVFTSVWRARRSPALLGFPALKFFMCVVSVSTTLFRCVLYELFASLRVCDRF